MIRRRGSIVADQTLRRISVGKEGNRLKLVDWDIVVERRLTWAVYVDVGSPRKELMTKEATKVVTTETLATSDAQTKILTNRFT